MLPWLVLFGIEARGAVDQVFHRVLWNGTVLSSNEWDRVAEIGFTIVHSYGSDPATFRQMLDEAGRRGLKMIGGATYPQSAAWLELRVDRAAAGTPSELWPHVIHHYTQAAPSLILYGQGFPGLAEGLQIVLNDPDRDTIGELAAYLNQLGGGIRAAALPGKEGEPSTLLATGWFGNAAESTVTLNGSDFLLSEAQFQRYVTEVKDHPALFCFAPFDDPEIRPFSPVFQRSVRDKLRQWAPNIPVYLLVGDLGRSGGTVEHDHKIAPEAFDGFVLYTYPHDWEGSGTWRDVESLRTLLQEWTRTPHSILPKQIIHLVAAFAQDNSPWTLPPEQAIRMEWETLRRSDVPLAGFGYYTWSGHTVSISTSSFLQDEVADVNRDVAASHVEVAVTPALQRILAGESATFEADVRGAELPLVLQWDFGDGSRAWGQNPTHTFAHPGTYEVALNLLDRKGRQFFKTVKVCVLGSGANSAERDFEDGILAGFVTHSGSWSAETRALRQTDPDVNDARLSFTSGTGPQYTIETGFRLTGDRNRLWLIYSGAATGSVHRLEVEPLNQAIYAKEGLTCRVRLSSDKGTQNRYLPLRRHDLHRLTVDVLAESAVASLDGQVLIEIPHGGKGGDGVIGFGSEGTAGEFDDFRVAGRNPLQVAPSVQLDGSEQPRRFLFDSGVVGGNPPLTYLWDFGDGVSSSEPNPRHEYSTDGPYVVRVRVLDASGAIREAAAYALAGAQVFFREAEDYDWSDGNSPGHPVQAIAGQQYGSGQNGRRRLDFFQAVRGQGDQSNWRDAAEVSLASDAGAGGIVIGWTSPGDWWNYTFDFPAAGLARIRAQFSAERPVTCRVFWRDRFICDLHVPGNGFSNWIWVDSPAFAVDGEPGYIRFQVLEGSPGNSLNFSRFEVAFAPGADSDADGYTDVSDWDRDGDGFTDSDEASNSQSNYTDASSLPPDLDQDFISDANDADEDGDGAPDSEDPFPRTANRPPVIAQIPAQSVRANELLSFQVGAADFDLPAQALTFSLEGDVPSGAMISSAGVFTWTPTRDQASTTYVITVAVTDDGSPPLKVAKTFTVAVTDAQSTGFASVSITTTNGPVTVVVPRKEYRFTALNRTLFVAATGDDSNPGTLDRPWRTFAHALSRLLPGDLLYARAGTYTEVLEINRSGTRTKPIVISAYPGEQVRIRQPEGWQQANEHGSTAAFAWGTKHVWFHGFDVEGGWRPGTPHLGGFDRSCILVTGESEGVRILNNLCSRSYDSGIQARFATAGAFLIEGNVVWECGTHFHGSGISLDAFAGPGVIVRGNTVLQCGSGIFLNAAHTISVYNNLIVDVATTGTTIGSASGNTVAHNVWVRNGVAGLAFASESKTNVVLNNIFLGNTPRHLAFNEFFGAADLSVLGNVLDYCVLDPRSELASPPELFTWLGSHLNRSDPQFVDEERFDFRLQSTSPARNHVTPLVLPGANAYPDPGLFSATNYWVPELNLPSEFRIAEGEEASIPLELADPIPEGISVRFELVDSPPTGLRLDRATGVITWTPTERQGASTTSMRILTTAGSTPLLDSVSTLTIHVLETNAPPVQAAGADHAALEGTPFTFTPSATDSDVPANQLVWSLGSNAPSGLSVDPATGAITWTPDESHGGAGHPFTVVVTDDGVPPLSDSKLLTITVAEVNSAPELSPIPDQSIDAGRVLTFGAAATDSDFPANALTFRLAEGAPDGAVITAAGIFSWSPTLGQGGAIYPITVMVTDDGTPALANAKTFQVNVTAIQTEIKLINARLLPDGQLTFAWNAQPGVSYRVQFKSDLTQPNWTDIDLPTSAEGETATFTTPINQGPQSFYRVMRQL